jgi:hypothetical protein
MMGFFPKMYKGEILYSILARYHRYSINRGYRDTLDDLFNCVNVIPSIEFPSHLRHFTEEIKKSLDIEEDYFIMNHTLYPYYAPFMDSKTKAKLTNMMCDGDGKGIKVLVGFVAGSVCKKDGLYYCPECSLKDDEKLEEPYIYSLHQAQGVKVCTTHKCYLEKYPVNQLDVSRLKYICFEHDIVQGVIPKRNYIPDDSALIKVANSAKFLLENDMAFLNIDKVKEIYRRRLYELGFLTPNGTVRQNALCHEVIQYYGNQVLEELQSAFLIENDYNWVKVITRDDSRKVHPLRHILLINYLFGDIQTFFEVSKRQEKIVFYPCLNPVAEHFKEHIIEKVIVTADLKTREPVGTFQCECGFIYSRKFVDAEIYNIGRIKVFGHVWENELNKQVVASNKTIRGIANQMGCDSKTVVNYARKLGIEEHLNTNMKLQQLRKKTTNEATENLAEIYEQDIKGYIGENPLCTRLQIRENLNKQYAFLYRNQKETLLKVLPEKSKPSNGYRSKDIIESWKAKDREYLQLINEVVSKLEKEDMQRVSRTMLLRKTGKGATLEKNLFRLPLCSGYLTRSCLEYVHRNS